MDKNRLTLSIGGKELTFETGKIARLAGGSVVLRSGDTVILATACSTKEAAPNASFLPLRVDYQEKFSAAGKTLGGFIKREGKQSEKETLVSRLIDRPIRPLFPEGYYNDVQLLCYVLSYDNTHLPEPLAICAVSAAVALSDIPISKPLGAVRVGMIDGQFIINPTLEEQGKSKLDLILAGTEDAILMIEGYCDFLTEEEVLAAIEEGHASIKEICKGLNDFRAIAGKEKVMPTLRLPPQELTDEMASHFKAKLQTAFAIQGKLEREESLFFIKQEVNERFLPKTDALYSDIQVKQAFDNLSSSILRHKILSLKTRTDGRALDEIRPITIEQALLPRTHGSTLFTRGETQAIAVCTLGGESMGQRYEDLEGEGLRKFYLQYSFPPYSVGEVGRGGPPGRREIGHGKLAERALQAIIPTSREAFPYTIRLESNITESNGSSSMASVCGGCLAMMDAGVPIARPVSGIAMGLILEGHEFAILSDILGLEDALGDMDFKITGDAAGITAFQMDIKVEGITSNIMKAALMQAKKGRIHILNKMLAACPASRSTLSPHAPRIETMVVKPSKIATIIGPGGKMIRSIIEETGAQIDINDEGIVNISSTSAVSLNRAKEMIYNLIAEIEIGKVYKGPVVSIQPFGAFVRLPGTKDGLCHISELSHQRVQKVEDVVKEGDEIEVKVLEINDRGQIKLSHKVLLPKS
ncbi:MAG: polyribonucleotide nucleotidyltransferase [Verrucomicrobia bacterium]|nr:polyribonucleotide nucleotidyltransferase [Verrucomicrobiota bacterium]